MSSSSRAHKHQKSLSSSRASTSNPKTEVTIHVYDLLPPGRLSSILWTFGGSLLHSGVVVNGKEYAYGGHDRKHVSGVYYTAPKLEPPGGTFRLALLHGFSLSSEQEIQDIINETSHKFQGTSYNLLSQNCNHFTSYLCQRLTGTPAPAWLNRAASVGLALPCFVPQEWIAPPDVETACGELVDEHVDDDDDDDDDENVGMLASDHRRQRREDSLSSELRGRSADVVRHNSHISRNATPPARIVSVKDTNGRQMPASERAPLPKR